MFVYVKTHAVENKQNSLKYMNFKVHGYTEDAISPRFFVFYLSTGTNQGEINSWGSQTIA